MGSAMSVTDDAAGKSMIPSAAATAQSVSMNTCDMSGNDNNKHNSKHVQNKNISDHNSKLQVMASIITSLAECLTPPVKHVPLPSWHLSSILFGGTMVLIIG